MPGRSLQKPRWYLSPGALMVVIVAALIGVLWRLPEYGRPPGDLFVPAFLGLLCGAVLGFAVWLDRRRQAGIWASQLVGAKQDAPTARALWVQKFLVLGCILAVGGAARLLTAPAARLAFDAGLGAAVLPALLAMHRLVWQRAWEIYRGPRPRSG